MSFSIDLWNGFDLLKNKYNSTYNKVQILYNILITFINMEKDYSKNLDILYKDKTGQIKEEFLLEQSFIQLIENIKEQSEYHKKHIDFVSKYLVIPLKEVIDQQKSVFQLFTENTKNLENFEKSKNILILKEEKYHNSCRELTNYFIANDSKMLNNSISNDKSMFNKRQKLVDKINDNKKEYISMLYEANIDLDQYNTKTNQILNDLENKYESILDLLKWSLINYTNNKIVLYDKTNNLYKTALQKYFTNINCNEEMMNFIKSNLTKQFPVFKFDFIPYKLNNININLFKENERKNNLNECNKKINLIKKFFTDNQLINNTIPKEENNESNNTNNKNNNSVITNSLKKLISIEKEAIKKTPVAPKRFRNISQELNYNSLNNISNRFVLKDREAQMKANITYIEFFIDKLMLKKTRQKSKKLKNLEIYFY